MMTLPKLTVPPLLAQFAPLPVMMKEMRGRFRDGRASVILLIVIGIACLGEAGVLLFNWPSGGLPPSEYGTRLPELAVWCLLVLLALQLAAAILIVPAATGGAFTAERERQALEMLLLTPLTNANLAAGKLLSAVGYLLVLQLAVLPLAGIVLILGGASVGDVLWGQGVVLAATFAIGAIGVYCSVLFRRTVVAIVMAYVFMLLFLSLVPLIALGEAVIDDGSLSVIAPVVACSLLVMPFFGLPLARWTKINPGRAMLYTAAVYLAIAAAVNNDWTAKLIHLPDAPENMLNALLLLPFFLGLGWLAARAVKRGRLLVQLVLTAALYAVMGWLWVHGRLPWIGVGSFRFRDAYSVWLIGNPIFDLFAYFQPQTADLDPDWLHAWYPCFCVLVNLIAGGAFFAATCHRLGKMRAGG